MMLPGMLHGTRAKVVPRVRRLVKTLLKTKAWSSYDPGEFVATADVSGQVLANRPVILNETHFHCYAISEEISRLSEQSQLHANIHEWLMASLDDEWRFICTLGGSSALGLRGYDASFSRRYVEAAVQYWPAIAGERGRFDLVLPPASILACWTTLIIAIEILGLPPMHQLRLPNREPKALLALADERRSVL